MKTISLIIAGLLLTGCVTKPQLLASDTEQVAAYRPAQSCKEVRFFIGVNREYIERLESTDAHSFYSFMLDFNMGNGEAKYNGLKLARARLAELEAAEPKHCPKKDS